MKTAANILLAFILSFSLGTGVLYLNQILVQNLQSSNSYESVVAASGRLTFEDGHGSATIGYVRGRLVVITAGHCFEDDREKTVLNGTDSIGQPYSIRVRCVFRSPTVDISLAVVCPDQKIPEMVYPDLTPVDAVTIGETILQASYPLNLSKVIHKGQLVGIEESPWEYPPTAGMIHKILIEGLGAPGSSGSSVWVLRHGQWRLAGIYVGSFKPYSTAKICVSYKGIQQALAEYEP